MGRELTAGLFARLAELYEQLSGLEPPARDARLAALAESEPTVHAELAAMLADQTAAEEAEARLEGLVSKLLAEGLAEGRAGEPAEGRAEESAEERAEGETVDLDFGPGGPSVAAEGLVIADRFRLLHPLGAGGMGEVWAAEQLRPVARTVAVKIMRRGLSSPAAAGRFQAERQALATMDHPNIASIFDGGELADGKPYFVMELVADGQPITGYCAERELGLEARLRLMLQVCEAVEHAHQKRIIHRDLKPSNVLVCERASGTGVQDPAAVPVAVPVVKVIDFGIAKPLTEDGDLVPGATRADELMGTPEYMSPEQAAFGAVDIDTRSDVYSLGLMLYELLVGEGPHGGETFRSLPIYEQCRRIREDDPTRPSTRIRQAATPALPAADGPRVRGDLDRIVLAALARDRSERYRSAAALADDLRRFLDHQPIQVAPQTLAYQAAKFVRRHRLAVSFAALALAGVLVALAGVTAGLVRAQRAEEVARTEAATTRKISAFLEGLLREGNPEEAEGAGSVRGLLDRGAERVRSELADEPVVRARLMLTIADAYRALGQYEPAIELADEALVVSRSAPKPNPADVAAALDVLTHILMNARRHERALETAQEHHLVQEQALGAEHPDLADSLFQIGTAHWSLGNFEQARESLEEAIARRSSPDGAIHESLPRLQNNLAILYWQLGRLDDAERLYRQALASLRTLRGPDHAHVASTLNNLALVHEHNGDYEQALAVHRQALEIRERIFDPPHPDLAESLNNIGASLNELGRQDEAREVLERALSDRRAIFGDGANDLVASTLYNLAKAQPAGQERRARELFEQSLVDFEASLGSEHPTVAYPLVALGRVEHQAGRHEAALPLLRRAVDIRRRALPAEHPLLADAESALCEVLAALGLEPDAGRVSCDGSV